MKAKFFAIAALVLGLASCQKDFAPDATQGGEVNYRLSISAPELAKTRAAEDGKSEFGAVDYYTATDWSKADLRYILEVWDADENGNAIGDTPVKDRQAVVLSEYASTSFEVRLVQNRNYRFVVFADFVEDGAAANWTDTQKLTAAGLNHQIGATLKDIKVINEEINNESADAYFKGQHVCPTHQSTNEDAIVLQRPYAKVRVVATDLHELNLNVKPAAVKVSYYAANPNAFDAVTGKISGTYTEVEFSRTYADAKSDKYGAGYDALTTTTVNGDVRNTHKTLFTDYILAVDEQTTISFDMTVYEDEEYKNAIKTTKFNTEIPIQRNHLTTIIGDVLTTGMNVNITIDDNFANGTEWNPADDEYDVEVSFVDSAASLQEALDNYVNGQVILVSGDIEGDVTVNQVEGKDYVIDGNGHKFDGTIFIDGNSNLGGAETVLIQNFNFETAKDNINFIEQNSTASDVRYPHNVTIKNCSFNATGDTVVGIRFKQGRNIVIEDCVANGTTRASKSGLHSLGQFPGCTDVTINNVDVDALEGGFNLYTSKNITIKNSTIVARDYAVRVDANHADDRNILNIENVDFTAKYPVVARYFTTNYTINFAGDNKLTAPGYQVVLTAVKDDMTLVAPTGEYTLTGAEDFVVFPGNVLCAYNQADLQSHLDNAVDGNIIRLAEDIEGDVTVTQKADVKITIDGNNHNFAGVILVDGKSKTYTTAGVTIKNINFKADAISADAVIRLGKSNDNNTRYTCNVTVEGCTFDVPGAVGVKSYTGGDKNLTIKDCTVTANAHSLVQAKGIDVILVEKCTVNSKNGLNFNNSNNVTVDECTVDVKGYAVRYGEGSAATGGAETYYITNSTLKSACEDGDAVIILRGTADKATLNITNTKLEGDPMITNNAVDAEIFIDGNKYVAEGLLENENGDQIALSEAGLKAALENGGTVILANPFTIDQSESNGYGKTGINMTNGGTLDGNGNELGAPGSTGTWDSAINTSGGTIKNLKVSKGFRGIFIKKDTKHNEKLYLDNVTIDGTTYTISCDSGNGLGLEATNSTFKGWTSYAASLGNAKFTNCYFGEGNGYSYCRPYAPTEFVGCEFEAGLTLDPRADVTFENCTIGGVAVTAENLSTFVTNTAKATVK